MYKQSRPDVRKLFRANFFELIKEYIDDREFIEQGE